MRRFLLDDLVALLPDHVSALHRRGQSSQRRAQRADNQRKSNFALANV